MTDGDGEHIKYTTKELLGRIELSLGEKIDHLAQTVDRITTLHETELRDVRHRVANLEAERPLRARIDAENERHRVQLQSDVTDLQQEAARRSTVQTLEADINYLKTESASQHAVDNFKKWLYGSVIFGLAGLIIATVQLFQN